MGGPVRIFSYLPNPRLWKATIAGRLCDVEVQVRGASPDELKNWLWDFDAKPITDADLENLKGLARRSRKGFGESFLYKTDQFLEAQPFGNVPAAFSTDGKSGVFESNSILRLVARLGANQASLMGTGPFESSRIDSFLDAGLTFGHDTQRYLLALRSREISPSVHSAAQLALANYLTGVERALTRISIPWCGTQPSHLISKPTASALLSCADRVPKGGPHDPSRHQYLRRCDAIRSPSSASSGRAAASR